MPSNKTQPARGMRDFLPADVRRREYVIGVIREVYERYGFEPLETPAVENIETLMGKYGEEGNQLIFKILKRGVHESTGEADLALRYDLTVPLARVVAEYRDKLPKFFKRYQIQPVWRADRPARGRFREFYQCDVDVLGSKSMVVEAEICAAVSDVLERLGFDDFVIVLNHREILRGILEVSGVTEEKQADALIVIDKSEKIGKDGLRRELVERGVFSEESVDDFFERFGRLAETHVGPAFDIPESRTREFEKQQQEEMNSSWLDKLSSSLDQHEGGKLGIKAVRQILDLSQNSPARGRIRFHPSLARGLSYYTGAILEVGLNIGDFRGSIGGGGRYDNLVGMFLGQDVPACGFSLGLERIIVVMTEREMFPAGLVTSPAEVMVTVWNEESVLNSIALASELRAAGLRVDLYPEADKVGKQFKYASARGIPFVAVLGDDERERGEVSIKDMKSGKQRSVKREDVASVLRNWEG
ncbi:MAG: hisS [Acidobacteria bacterium]|nr:hisS [Acidobacteriota bacterium]